MNDQDDTATAPTSPGLHSLMRAQLSDRLMESLALALDDHTVKAKLLDNIAEGFQNIEIELGIPISEQTAGSYAPRVTFHYYDIDGFEVGPTLHEMLEAMAIDICIVPDREDFGVYSDADFYAGAAKQLQDLSDKIGAMAESCRTAAASKT